MPDLLEQRTPASPGESAAPPPKRRGRPRLMVALFALLFAGFWTLFCTVGQVAEAALGYLNPAGVGVSAQAILLAEGASPTFGHLSLMHPPLPFFMSIPFALLGLPHPAIWVSSLCGAILCSLLVMYLRGHIARQPVLVLPLILGILQPALIHAAISGSPDAVLFSLLIPAIYFLTRFALEHDAFERRRARSELPAWVEKHLFSDARMKFLWSFGFLIAAASLVRPGLIFAAPLIALAAPFLVSRDGWRHPSQSMSLAIVLLMPLIAVQLAWSYLFWIYTDNFLHGLDAPAVFFSNFVPHPADFEPIAVDSPLKLPLLVAVLAPLVWLIARLQNFGILFLMMAAPAAEYWTRTNYGQVEGSVTDLSLYGFFAGLMLLFLASDLKLIRKWETSALGGFLCLSAIASGWLFLVSPSTSGVVWWDAIRGKASGLETYSQERQFIEPLRKLTADSGPVLVDELRGASFIALMNTSRPLYLSHQEGFDIAAENPRAAVSGILSPVDIDHPAIQDRAARKWRDLPPSRTYDTSELHRTEAWVLKAWD